jgi:hypothetical protein
MGLIAPVLMGIVLFYWIAGCLTVIAWLKAISHLCLVNFIRAALWFVTGTWLLFWWFDKPHDWDSFMPGAITFIGAGIAGTIGRYFINRQAKLAIPASTPPFEATGNVVPFIKLQPKRD